MPVLSVTPDVRKAFCATFRLPLVLPVLFFLGCSADPAPENFTVRLVDHFSPDLLEGSPVEVKEPEPHGFWDFREPPETGSTGSETLGWKSGTGISRLRVRDGRLIGRTTTDFPILYVTRTSGLEEDDLIHSVEIRMRASKGSNLSVSADGQPEPKFEEILGRARAFPWVDTTPLVLGDSFQTYSLKIVHPVPSSRVRHLLIRPTDASGAEFEIESVRLVSRKEHLSRIPSGVGWQGLSEIYRETLVSRAPEFVRLDLQVPDDAFLDLHIGTVEYPPVTFRVDLAQGPSEPLRLLERTVTTPHRWEFTPVDLSRYAGQQVTLSFSLAAQEAGRLGFWGSPAVRRRAAVSPAAMAPAPDLPATGSRKTDPPQGVILIVADTLREDHLNFNGYERETAPFLAEIAGEGALFLDNIAQATWTKVSVPSLMTSLYPTSHRVINFNDRLPAAALTMAEVFRESGYATVAYSSVLFTGKFTNLHQGYEELHESGSTQSKQPSKTAREYVDRLTTWLEHHRDVPFFVFLHVFDPHDPYEPYQPYNSLWADPAKKEEHEEQLKKVREVIREPLRKQFGMPSRDELEEVGIDPQSYVSYDKDWYDGSIRAMDVEIERLVERLGALELLDRTLLVFTSDHGEEFLEHGRTFHGQTVYGELTNVPLVLYRPGVVPSGAVIKQTVQSIDIFPTILELSHLPKPEGLFGQSLVPLMSSAANASAVASSGALLADGGGTNGWKNRRAVSEKRVTDTPGAPPPYDTDSVCLILDGWKLIHNIMRPDGKPEFELYNHLEDPLNQNDVAAAHPEIVQRLESELERWKQEVLAAQLPAVDSTEGLSQEELQRLRSLGYIQ